MRGPKALILSALALICGMLWFVPFATARWGFYGYGLVLALYWAGFCVPLGLLFIGPAGLRRVVHLRLGGARWVPWAAFGLVLMVLGVTLAQPPAGVTVTVVALALAAGAINGLVEELYWRGAWLTVAGDDVRLFALGCVLFAAWHLPMALAVGVVYHGGPVALVGGAAALGLVWAAMAWRTRGIGWPMLSHAGLNMVVFQTLVATNLPG